jgi:tRNA dimethylallyltransferase
MTRVTGGASLDTRHSSRNVLVLVGPTASGKTQLSLLLAQHLNGEIISADSRQIYKYLDIGTAKPTIEERNKIKHYFLDELTPDEDFNAGEYGKRGRMVIDEIFRAGKQPIVVGGSGLYIQSLIDGLFEGPARDEETRKRLHARLQAEGAETLLNELHRVDPVSAAKMLPSNTRRIVRALEVYYLTGVPLSEHQKQQPIQRTFQPVFVGIEWDRKKLYERINRRAEKMIEAGLIDEVRSLQRMGYSSSLNSLQTVGYQEVFQYLEGKIDYETMLERFAQNSRRFAKRQLTWFRRDRRIRWFHVEDESEFSTIAENIVNYFRNVTNP